MVFKRWYPRLRQRTVNNTNSIHLFRHTNKFSVFLLLSLAHWYNPSTQNTHFRYRIPNKLFWQRATTTIHGQAFSNNWHRIASSVPLQQSFATVSVVEIEYQNLNLLSTSISNIKLLVLNKILSAQYFQVVVY